MPNNRNLKHMKLKFILKNPVLLETIVRNGLWGVNTGPIDNKRLTQLYQKL